jgi:hypothetical protein
MRSRLDENIKKQQSWWISSLSLLTVGSSRPQTISCVPSVCVWEEKTTSNQNSQKKRTVGTAGRSSFRNILEYAKQAQALTHSLERTQIFPFPPLVCC